MDKKDLKKLSMEELNKYFVKNEECQNYGFICDLRDVDENFIGNILHVISNGHVTYMHISVSNNIAKIYFEKGTAGRSGYCLYDNDNRYEEVIMAILELAAAYVKIHAETLPYSTVVAMPDIDDFYVDTVEVLRTMVEKSDSNYRLIDILQQDYVANFIIEVYE